MTRREIEDDLGPSQQIKEPRFLPRRAGHRGADVIRDIARPGKKLGIVQHLYALVDGADPIDMLRLQRRCDEYDERARRHRAI